MDRRVKARISVAAAAGLVSASLVVPSAAQADDCPNAGVRAQQEATFLPDCRAWEKVSPNDKSGNDVNDGSGTLQASVVQAVPDGSRVGYQSTGSFGGTATSVLATQYMGSRGGAGWSTVSVSPLQVPSTSLIQFGTLVNSSDLSHSVVASQQALTPDAIQNNGNIYLRDNVSGGYRLIVTDPSLTPLINNPVVATSPDLSHVVLTTFAALTPDAAPGVRNLFEWTEAGGVELISRLPDGSVDPGGGTIGAPLSGIAQGSTGHPVSDDGSRVVYTTGIAGTATNLYLRRPGARTIEISASQAADADPTTSIAAFRAASRDGNVVYFTDVRKLTNGSTAESSTGTGDLYRYDVASGLLADVTIGTGPSGGNVRDVIGVSDDGATVYFIAGGLLVPGAIEGESNVYVLHHGRVDLLATAASTDTTLTGQASPNGEHFAMTSASQLTSYDNQGRVEVYGYSDGDGRLACVSCDQDGDAMSGPASLGPSKAGPFGYIPRSVLDDGRVFFDTPASLVPLDTNGLRDVYEYDGSNHLISSGRGTADAVIEDVTPDGGTVYFATRGQLVISDDDDLNDLYAARVGGGFATTTPPPGCVGDACQGPAPAPPGYSNPPTSSFDGPGDSFDGRPAVRPSVRIVRRAVAGSAVVLTVRTSGAGKLSLTGAGLRTAARRVRSGGAYRLRAALTRAALTRLKRKGSSSVRVRVVFAPTRGAKTSVETTIRFKASQRRAASRKAVAR